MENNIPTLDILELDRFVVKLVLKFQLFHVFCPKNLKKN